MSRTTPPPAAVRGLPVMQTLSEAYGRVFTNLHLVVRAALVPFVLSLVLIVASIAAAETGLLTGLVVILGFVPYTIFGVAWHRVTLLGPVAGAPPLVPPWAGRHWRFLGYLVAVMLIGYGVALTVMSLVFAVTLGSDELKPVFSLAVLPGIGIILAYVMMRLSFVFPAVAVDEAYWLRHSWTHTKGQGFRLLGAVLFAALPMVLLLWIVSVIFGTLLFTEVVTPDGQGSAPPEAQFEAFIAQNLVAIFVSQMLIAAINYVLMALVVSIISIGFRTCTGWVPDTGGAPLAPAPGNGENSGERG